MNETPLSRTAGPLKMKPCPICGKMAMAETRPFCSTRCRQVDLNRWLSGRYAIPVVEADGDEE